MKSSSTALGCCGAVAAALLLGGCFLLGAEESAPAEATERCREGQREDPGTRACVPDCAPGASWDEVEGCVPCDPSCEGRACGEPNGCGEACDGACFVWTVLKTADRPEGRGHACLAFLPDEAGGSFLLAGGFRVVRVERERSYELVQSTWRLDGALPAGARWTQVDESDSAGDAAELPMKEPVCVVGTDRRLYAFGQPDGSGPARVFRWNGAAFDELAADGAPAWSGGSLLANEDGTIEWLVGCDDAARLAAERCTYVPDEGFTCRPMPWIEREIETYDDDGGTIVPLGPETVRLRGATVLRDPADDRLLVQGGTFRAGSGCGTGVDWAEGGALNESLWSIGDDGVPRASAALGPAPRERHRLVAGPSGLLSVGGSDPSQSPTEFPTQSCTWRDGTWSCRNDCRFDGERWSCADPDDPCHGRPEAGLTCAFSANDDPAVAASEAGYVVVKGWIDDGTSYQAWFFTQRSRLGDD